MRFNLLQRGGGILRYLHRSDALARPTRMINTNGHVRRICLPISRYSINPVTKTTRPEGILSRTWSRSFATANDADEDVKPTKSKKTTKTKKSRSKKAKSKAKPKTRRTLTEKQKEAKKAKESRETLKQLKLTALEPPKKLPEFAWNLAVTMKIAEAKAKGLKGKEAFKEATQMAKSIGFDENENVVQRVTAQAEANKAANEAAYNTWIKSFTPLQIKEANAARRRLAKLKNTRAYLLRDDRLVKRPLPAYMRYMMERTQEGDFKYMKVADIAARVAEEWKGLTGAEKEKYLKQAEIEREQYRQRCREVYGEEPHSSSASESP
ncbi:HMG-box domain-containing protein [Aspergillus clavatus NRRL 1]|uniref:HMG box protein n=1 Tax=Aspergillus clavatus (strain ATCC 1007 / CBS 513.65 / DSM 816 / NCTC 3887 / NRRL 1 / QM 1276 / 107) TaxID=344612 RepID=A1CQB0_ASPCL|nr:HMG box protein [Aspergillus clavatus NRRL 1]EAW07831.1 HMG box protein [Aspergillus clavatus NRRL 1]